MLFNVAENLTNPKRDSIFHKGIVVDNKDEKRAGRVRALVEGRLEVKSTDYDRLPWLLPDKDATSGGREDMANAAIPPIGSEIKVRFHDDNPYVGFYSGSMESSESHNGFLVDDNYPHTSARMNSDGSWSRTDSEKNTSETFRSLDKLYHSVDANGNVTINVPKDLVLHVGGKLRIRCGTVEMSVADFLLKAADIQAHSSKSINFKADASLNIDAPTSSENLGLAVTTKASAAKTALDAGWNTLNTALTQLQKQTVAVLKASKEFNQGVVTTGVSGANSEPTVGTTTSYTKQVVDYSYNPGASLDLDRLKSGGLLKLILGLVPGLKTDATAIKNEVNDNLLLEKLLVEATALQVLNAGYTNAKAVAANTAITALDDILLRTQRATGATVLQAITSNKPLITGAVSLVNSTMGYLESVQAIRARLPGILNELDALTSHGLKFGNAQTKAAITTLVNSIVAVNIVGLEELRRKSQALLRVAAIALQYEVAGTSLQSMTVADPTDVKNLLTSIATVTRIAST